LQEMPEPSTFINDIDNQQLTRIFVYFCEMESDDRSLTTLFKQLTADSSAKLMQNLISATQVKTKVLSLVKGNEQFIKVPKHIYEKEIDTSLVKLLSAESIANIIKDLWSETTIERATEQNIEQVIKLVIKQAIEQAIFFFDDCIKNSATQAEILFWLQYEYQAPALVATIIERLDNIDKDEKIAHLSRMITYLYDKHQQDIDPRPIILANLLFDQLVIPLKFTNALKVFNQLKPEITVDIWQRIWRKWNPSQQGETLSQPLKLQREQFYNSLLRQADSQKVAIFISHLDIESQAALLIAVSQHSEATDSQIAFTKHLQAICALNTTVQLQAVTNIICSLLKKGAIQEAQAMLDQLIANQAIPQSWNKFDKDATAFFIQELFKQPILLLEDETELEGFFLENKTELERFLDSLAVFISRLEPSAQAEALLIVSEWVASVTFPTSTQQYIKFVDVLFHNNNGQLGADEAEVKQHIERAAAIIKALLPPTVETLVEPQQSLIRQIFASIAKGLNHQAMQDCFSWLIQGEDQVGIGYNRAKIISQSIDTNLDFNQQFQAAFHQLFQQELALIESALPEQKSSGSLPPNQDISKNIDFGNETGKVETFDNDSELSFFNRSTSELIYNKDETDKDETDKDENSEDDNENTPLVTAQDSSSINKPITQSNWNPWGLFSSYLRPRTPQKQPPNLEDQNSTPTQGSENHSKKKLL